MSEVELIAPLAGWAMPLWQVPDPAFAGGLIGDGLAIDPTGDTLHAPCAGTILTVHAARHAVTMAAEGGVELLMHIGIDSVALAGDGFTALVGPGDRVAAGDPLIRFDLDRLVTRARAAATPLIVTGAGNVRITRHADGLIAVGAPLMRIVSCAAPFAALVTGPHLTRDVAVSLPHGLHARPAGRIAASIRGLAAEVTLSAGGKTASAASPTGLLGLALGHGATVTVTARGIEAEAALARVAELLTREETTDRAPPAPAVAETPRDGLRGVAAAPGLALGPACWLRRARPAPPARGGGVDHERVLFERGLAVVRADLAVAAAAPGQTGNVLAAHREILDDPAILEAAAAAIATGASAAAAILEATEAQARLLGAVSDPRIAERADDIRDVGERIAHAILGTRAEGDTIPAGSIVLADDLLPSQFAALDPARIAGFALTRGGPTAHVAILAAGVGLPMVVALGPALASVTQGTTLLLDGDVGRLQVDPDPAARAEATAAIAARAAAEALARTLGSVATLDGTPVAVQANCGSATEAAAALAAGADGCGLLRTEFLFLDRATAPGPDEQAAAYRAVLDALPDRPVTIRLLDLGGDKPAPYLGLPPEENPALGVRGVRIALSRPDLLEAQLASILALPDLSRAQVMVPMVASAGEVAAVRAVLDRLRGARTVTLGAMIETPAAAIGADLIAREADFLSIGSNDLTQYVLAADRGNAGVAALLDGLHPAVLRLIAETCTRAGRTPVSVCGGLAADTLAVPILIGLGVRTLSVPPARIAGTKATVARLTRAAAESHARAALACASAAAVRTLAARFAEDLAR